MSAEDKAMSEAFEHGRTSVLLALDEEGRVELGKALKRVQDNPVPPVIRRYDRLFKEFMTKYDLADFEVTKIAYDELAKLKACVACGTHTGWSASGYLDPLGPEDYEGHSGGVVQSGS